MKKIGLVLLLVCFLLVGCGKTETTKKDENKTETKKNAVLTCSTFTKGDLDFTTYMTFYLENDKTTKLGVKYVYDLSKYTEDQRTAMKNANMCEMDEMKTQLGMVDCKAEISGTDLVVEGFAEKLLEKVIGTASELKKSYEDAGWTCTLE